MNKLIKVLLLDFMDGRKKPKSSKLSKKLYDLFQYNGSYQND
jgi:hypothetical protein